MAREPSEAPHSGIRLNGEKTPEKRPIAAQCKPEILGRYALVAVQLPLKLRPFIRKYLRQALHRTRDQTIGLLHRAAGFVHKATLDGIPANAKLLRLFKRKQRRRLIVGSHLGCNCGRYDGGIDEGPRTASRYRHRLADVSQSRCRVSCIFLVYFCSGFVVHRILQSRDYAFTKGFSCSLISSSKSVR